MGGGILTVLDCLRGTVAPKRAHIVTVEVVPAGTFNGVLSTCSVIDGIVFRYFSAYMYGNLLLESTRVS